MFKRHFAKLFIALTATLIGLCQAAHAQTEFPPAYDNQAHYAVGDLVTDYGNLYRCEVAVTKPYLDPSKTYQNWEMFYVRNDTTIPVGVGQTFPTLAIAWKYVHNARVATDAYLHVNIVTSGGNFDESFTAPLNLDMDNGAQVSIIGDNAANISLSFGQSSGLTIDTNHSLASISNLSIYGSTISLDGIYAGSGATILNLNDININYFEDQIYAEQSSKLVFGTGIVETNGQTFGCYVDDGGSVTFAYQGLMFTGSGGGCTGLNAQRGGRILAEAASLQDAGHAVISTLTAYADVEGVQISDCLVGCYASYAGYINAEGSTFTNESGTDLVATNNATIDAQNDTSPTMSTSSGGTIFS